MNNFFKKILSRLTKGKAGHYRPKTQDAVAHLHWKIILVSFFIAIVAVSFNSVWIYKKISTVGIDQNASVEGQKNKVVTLESLKKVVEKVENQKKEFENIRDYGVSTVDPSR